MREDSLQYSYPLFKTFYSIFPTDQGSQRDKHKNIWKIKHDI